MSVCYNGHSGNLTLNYGCSHILLICQEIYSVDILLKRGEMHGAACDSRVFFYFTLSSVLWRTRSCLQWSDRRESRERWPLVGSRSTLSTARTPWGEVLSPAWHWSEHVIVLLKTIYAHVILSVIEIENWTWIWDMHLVMLPTSVLSLNQVTSLSPRGSYYVEHFNISVKSLNWMHSSTILNIQITGKKTCSAI